MRDPAEMTRFYKKGLSVNNFKNFKSVMEMIHDRKIANQGSKLNTRSCNRNACKDRASTFYVGPDIVNHLAN